MFYFFIWQNLLIYFDAISSSLFSLCVIVRSDSPSQRNQHPWPKIHCTGTASSIWIRICIHVYYFYISYVYVYMYTISTYYMYMYTCIYVVYFMFTCILCILYVCMLYTMQILCAVVYNEWQDFLRNLSNDIINNTILSS